MQTLSRHFLQTEKETEALIFAMQRSALSNVPFHADTKFITRYFSENFPVHLAVHEISPVMKTPEEYTLPHVHDGEDEVNIIISRNNLVYKIQLDNDEYIVENNSSIWIPAGMQHSANVIKGSGYFITMRMTKEI